MTMLISISPVTSFLIIDPLPLVTFNYESTGVIINWGERCPPKFIMGLDGFKKIHKAWAGTIPVPGFHNRTNSFLKPGSFLQETAGLNPGSPQRLFYIWKVLMLVQVVAGLRVDEIREGEVNDFSCHIGTAFL